MAGNSIHINPNNNTVVVQEGQTQIIEVKAVGPQGRIGPQGPAGPSGSMATVGPVGAIQFAWVNGEVSGSSTFSFDPSTYTLALSGSFLISGSILPDADPTTGISSFSLGSLTNAWKDLYVGSQSIYFVSASTAYALQLTSSNLGLNTLAIDGNTVALTNVPGLQNISASYAATASYTVGLYSDRIYSGNTTASVAPSGDVFSVNSGTDTLLKVNSEGVLVLKTQTTTPTPVAGGLFYSGSGDFFLGV